MIHAHALGQKGEKIASQFLQKKGMKIINKNWRHCNLEIDIICKDNNTLVFVEVKTRKKASYSRPYEALTPKKCHNLIQAAQHYLSCNKLWSTPCRFDVIGIVIKNDQLELEYYPNVFELSETMDYSNTSWQPW